MTRPDPAHGVFETLLVCDGRVQALDAHLERLAASVSALYGERLPGGLRAEILSTAESLAGAHRMRVDAMPDTGAVRTGITSSALGAPRVSALIAAPVTISDGLGPHKWRDRRRLDALGEQAGPDRVVMICDDDGQVLEAAWANVWLLDEDRLRTAPADGRILSGVTRARLLSLAPSLGLRTSEAPIAPADLRAAGAVFLTSSLRVSVVTCAGQTSDPIDPRVAAIAQALADGDWS